MIDAILPETAIAIEMLDGAADCELFPEEVELLGRAVRKRQREFTTARACARRAFAQLGLPPAPVTRGVAGAPRWPPGLVGSITHCERYCACAIARASDIAMIGIDAEPNVPLPHGVLHEIAHGEELAWLQSAKHDDPTINWDRLLFSAKEAVYKAVSPIVKRPLEFDDGALRIEPSGNFRAQLEFTVTAGGQALDEISGRWLVSDGLLLTTAFVAAASPAVASRAVERSPRARARAG
ncbi:MAG TPA: 4'-phosphopantetheinyl transferase superfamily protein [Solirubrobacteraceae bacterium]|jgi:4'-phosphopantetheinyl transferase EntD|nr:4'-phosphopantetheinyl transferase superfamily protein [Solirubrobacteraceae bacterium]